MKASWRRIAAALLAVVALFLYVFLQWSLFRHVWSPTAVVPTEMRMNLAVTLSGLVGGVVAGFFGQTLPKPFELSRSALATRTLNKIGALGDGVSGAVLAEHDVIKSLIGALYFACYVVIGVVAVVIAFSHNPTPGSPIYSAFEQTKNVALVFIGLMIAIVTAWFKE